MCNFEWAAQTLLRKGRFCVFLAAFFLATGCATNKIISTSADFAAAGSAYSKTLIALLDATAPVYIDARSAALIDIRSSIAAADGLCGGSPKLVIEKPDCDIKLDERNSCAWLATKLACYENSSKEFVALTATLRKQISQVNSYFVALKAFVDYDATTEGGAALGSTADAINTLTTQLSASPLMKGKQIDGVKQFGGIIADAYKAELIQKALERDAPIIDKALAWQGQVFQTLSDLTMASIEDDRNRSYRELVAMPFLTDNNFDPSAWSKQRRETLSFDASVAELSAAKDASEKMRMVWADILAKRYQSVSASELIAELEPIAEAIDAIQAND
jgi:hypothetical protein